MNTIAQFTENSREPICTSIENCLNELGKQRSERFTTQIGGSEVCLSFGPYSASGPIYDIALVKLALEIVRDERYGDAMRDALSSEMAWHESHSCAA